MCDLILFTFDILLFVIRRTKMTITIHSRYEVPEDVQDILAWMAQADQQEDYSKGTSLKMYLESIGWCLPCIPGGEITQSSFSRRKAANHV